MTRRCRACAGTALPGSFGCAQHPERVTGPAPVLLRRPVDPVDLPTPPSTSPALSPWDLYPTPSPRPVDRARHGRVCGAAGCVHPPGPVDLRTPIDVADLCGECRVLVKGRALDHRRRGTGVTRAEIVAMVRAGADLRRRPQKAGA